MPLISFKSAVWRLVTEWLTGWWAGEPGQRRVDTALVQWACHESFIVGKARELFICSSHQALPAAPLSAGEHQERGGSPRGEFRVLGLVGGLRGVVPDAQDEARAGTAL